MKRSIFLFLFFISAFVQAQNFANPHYMDPYNPEFEPNEVIVKFVDDATPAVLKSDDRRDGGLGCPQCA